MGCVCCSLSSFVSIVLDAVERVSLCTVCAMLVCCLLFTISCMLLMGIGIGYNYCSVQTAVEAMDKAAQAAGAVRSGPEGRRSGRRTDYAQFPRLGVGEGRGGRMNSGMRSLERAASRMRSLDDIPAARGRRHYHNPMPSNNNTINDLIFNNTDVHQNLTANLTLLGGAADVIRLGNLTRMF